MGGYYALNDGYNKEIANAISEQYLPAHSGDRLPESGLGAILSLSDKLDNIASFFMLGLTPTGTEDPFALRRQAMGTVSILIDRRYNFNIGELLDMALQPFDIKNRQNLLNDIIKFFEQRIEYLFLSNGYSADSISAIINFAKDKPLYTLKERLDAIKKFKEEDADYDSFLLVIKRVNNIAPKNEPLSVKKELFVHEEEVSLFNELELITPQIHSILEQDKYYDAIKLLKTLKEPINRFFDRVLVMDKKEEVKLNRLSLIKNIQLLALEIADFSKLS
jgi:glycyl-tRNA synthetase beta chain